MVLLFVCTEENKVEILHAPNLCHLAQYCFSLSQIDTYLH